MHLVFLCLLGVALATSGAAALDISLLDSDDFPSKFIESTWNAENLTEVMKSHFNTSLDFLFASKYFGSQNEERPGISKLLSEESDRHWEAGISVLKKYLQLGGLTYKNALLDKMSFTSRNDLPNQSEVSSVKYISSFKTVMVKSRKFVNDYTNLNHAANRRSPAHGDADVAHFAEEMAEKESEVARKMAGHYLTLQKMSTSGIALSLFDKEL